MFSLRAKLRVSTVRRRLTSIAYYHRAGGFLSPITKTALAMLLGARRLLCERPRQKEAIGLDMLASMLAASGGTSAHLVRNRAILLIGFASALRRVNLVRLQMADLAESSRGVILSIRSEKQDRTGEGRVVAIPRGQNPDTCPIRALESWFGIRGRAPGPVFQGIKRNGKLNGLELHPSRVATIVKQAACRLGLDQKFFGAHSLRAGFVTAALENGVNEVMVMQQTGHKSLSSLKMYLRSRDPFRGNAAAALGL